MRIKTDLRNCDCMDLMKEFPDKYFELAIVDPPYGIKRFEKGIGKNDRHTVKSSSIFNNNPPDETYFKELFRVSQNQIIWGANNFQLPTTEYFCVWDKMQTVDNFASAEYAFVSMGLKLPAKVFRYSIHQHNSNGEKIHPTQKPVALYKWLLEHYAKKGDKILDTHLGSMSSVIACFEMGFDITGSELDADYYRAGIERVNKHTSQLRFDDFIEERI